MTTSGPENRRIPGVERSLILLSALLCALEFQGCTNSKPRTPTTSQVNASPSPGAPVDNSYKVSNITVVTAPSGAASADPITSIYFNTVGSVLPISSHCTPTVDGSTSYKPCVCQFSWQEVNSSSGTSIAIRRMVNTPVTGVQPNVLLCPAPSIYYTEILDETPITISVVPGPTSTSPFSVTPYIYTKIPQGADVGSFRDSQGRAFMNIMRYSCYDQARRGMAVQNKTNIASHSATGEAIQYWIANQFCVSKYSGSNPASNCNTLPAPEFSALSAYYNLFIRESEVGDINQGNGRFTCPLIKEALNSTGSIGTQGQYWPLDSSFALSMGRTSDFNIGVEAFSRTSNTAEPAGLPSSCDAAPGDSAAPAPNSLAKSCLGFATKPGPDGTCPYIRDQSGSIRFTYRLRRYIAIFPKPYDTDGKILPDGQPADTIYVLDRPVSATINPDPLKPFTMLGPKPCPVAYFDHKRVANPADTYYGTYLSTNDNNWTGKNVDGIEFPHVDAPNSCSAAVAVLNADKTTVAVGTINAANVNPNFRRVFVRPIRAWTPHYEEDTSFQACAPASSNFKDPPLHFARDSAGNVAWCAESVPTQNDNVAQIDPRVNAGGKISAVVTDPFSGTMRNYTSHVVKNSASSDCAATPVTIPNLYPSAAANVAWARHSSSQLVDTKDASKTCDRTVVNPPSGVAWAKFPLLSPVLDNHIRGLLPPAPYPPNPKPAAIEEALISDPSYACTMTFDNNGLKTGKATPKDGCCDPSKVFVSSGSSGASSAHLEPDQLCGSPKY